MGNKRKLIFCLMMLVNTEYVDIDEIYKIKKIVFHARKEGRTLQEILSYWKNFCL